MAWWHQLLSCFQSARVFRCRHCGHEFRIGVDSSIYTSDELRNAFAAGESTLFGFGSGFSRMPDIIGDCDYRSLPPAKAQEIRRDNETTLKKIDADPARIWTCGKCRNKQKYADDATPAA